MSSHIKHTIEDLKKMSLDELATLKGQKPPHFRVVTLIDYEIEHRHKEHQYDLALKLNAKQTIWKIISIVFALIGVVIGAFLTYYLTTSQYKTLSEEQGKILNQLFQEKQEKLAPDHHQKIIK